MSTFQCRSPCCSPAPCGKAEHAPGLGALLVLGTGRNGSLIWLRDLWDGHRLYSTSWSDARGATCSNSRPQPGAKTFGGLGGRWVGRSAAGVPRGGSVGTPKYKPQNDPHEALINFNIHNGVKIFFRKNLPIGSGSYQPRSDLEVRSRVKTFSAFFKHF